MRSMVLGILLSFVAILGFIGLLQIGYSPTTMDDALNASVIITDGWGHGSGTYIGNGVILTAGHVVDINDIYILTYDGRKLEILNKVRDPNQDIGFILVDPNCNLPALKFGDMPKILDTCYIIGTPIELCMAGNFSEGIITNVDVDIDGWWDNTLIADATSLPGNSGGCVLDDKFQIIGILVGGYMGSDSLSICEPVEDILKVMRSFDATIKR